MVIRTNTFANYAMMHLGRNDSRIRKDLERLSSGYKINRAADDAAGLAISEKMRSTIAGLNQGHQNELDGIGYIQVGDGALSEVHDMLRRMKTLSTEAANGTIDDTHRAMIDSEVQELKTEISRIGDETTYGGIHVFNNKVPALYIEGEIDDGVTIYNDTNDHYTPKNKSDDTQDFGGVRLHCKQPDGAAATDPVLFRRLRWDEIDAKRVDGTGQDIPGKMAQRNKTTGEWEFNPGEYDWTDSETNITYHFKVTAEDKVPEMCRMHEIKADPQTGISIDGNIVSWNDVKDAWGNSVKGMTTIAKGNYSFQYTTATISVYVPDTITNGLDGLSAVINSTQKFAGTGVEARAAISSTLMTDYAGTADEKAADTALNERRYTTSTLAKMMHDGNLNLYFTADEYGLSLYNRTKSEKENNQPGEHIGTMTWERLKVVKTGTNKDGTSQQDGWDWGKNASAAKSGANVGTDSTKFTFTAEWKPNYRNFNDTTWTISIPISISNVARDQAVYKALDGMQISHFDIRTTYAYKNSGTVTPDGTAPRLRDQKDNVSIKIGFTDEYVNSGRYDTKNNAYDYQSKVNVNDKTWGIEFSAYKKGNDGNYSTTDKWYTMTGNAESTLDAGKSYAASALDYMTGLTRANYVNRYVTPAGNATAKITVSGNTVSFDQIMKNLDGLDSKGFQLEKDTGNAYSLDHGWTVRFTSGQADELAYQATSSGLRYKTLSPSTGKLLLIDIDSLKRKGVTNDGSNSTISLASAIAEISGESGFYNGMSAKDGSLVISGDVTTVTDAPYATPTDGRYELNFTDKNDPSKKWDMLFAYSYADFSDKIKITANETAITSANFGTEMASNNVIYQKTAVTDNNGNVEYTYKRLNDTEKKNIISGIQQQADKKYSDYYNALTDAQKAKLTNAEIATQKQSLWNDSFNEKNPNLCKVDVVYTEKDTGKILNTTQAVDLAAETGLKNVIKSAKPTIHSGNGSTTFGYATNENYAGNVAARVQQHSEIVIAEGHSNILIQNSATIGDVSYIPRYPMNAIFLNLGATNTRTITNANRAMTQIDNAINIVSRRRAQFGSAQNALQHALRNNEVTTENVTSAESRIRDTDMANGVVALTKDKILSQAAQAMLAQANQLMSSTLTLLQ